MPVHLKISDSLTALAQCLGNNVHVKHAGVFEQINLVTQTRGMNNWLKLELSSESGIFSNYRFFSPNEIVQEVYHLMNGKRYDIISSSQMKWLVFSALDNNEFTQNFPEIFKYYQNNQSKQIALAGKIADLFDQYQIYRPELIEYWGNDNHLYKGDDDEKWQKAIWKICKTLALNSTIDRSIALNHVNEKIKEKKNQELIRSKFSSIHLFGLSVFTVSHLNFFKSIAPYCDIFFYIMNPSCGKKWMEKETEIILQKNLKNSTRSATGEPNNDWLENCGELIKNSLSILLKENPSSTVEILESPPVSSDKLLNKIQTEIHQNKSNSQRENITASELEDESIVINTCYTIAREVEIYYNYLIKTIEQSPEFSLRNTVVLVSDISSYAPYIRAVFDNAPYKLPYSVADEKTMQSNPLLIALIDLLETQEVNFTSEKIILLLENEIIRKRFDITNTEKIRAAVQRAGIRFGLKGDAATDTQYVSFQNGIDRLLSGYCLYGEEMVAWNKRQVYPAGIYEGQEAQEVISFCHFAELLMDFVQHQKNKLSLSEWVNYTYELINHFLLTEYDSESDEMKEISDELKKINSAERWCTRPVEYSIFKNELIKRLKQKESAGSFMVSGITFCSFIPMRSIPFDHVAMLGLNFDKFPRKEKNLNYDLISRYPRTGDRNIKQNDRHLFLETLLSARNKFYLSYVGRGETDNSRLLPSALVDELTDYIGKKFIGDKKSIKDFITLHPLHSFSNKYNSINKKLYSYLGDKKGKPPEENEKSSNSDDKITRIDMDELCSFFKNPFKHYYNKQLSVYYDRPSEKLEETENFSIDAISSWDLKNQLLNVNENELKDFREKLLKQGKIPLKNISVIGIREIFNGIKPVRAIFDEYREENQIDTISFSNQINKETEITGKLTGIYGDRLIEISFSKAEYKYLVSSLIKHLIGIYLGLINETVFISKEKNDAYSFKIISKKQAEKTIITLINLFKQGAKDILPYYNQLNEKANEIINYTEPEIASAFKKRIENERGPLNDPYLIREFKNGYFNQIKICEEFLENYKLIHGFLTENLPTYPFK